jgi:hypothetical protein
LKLLDSTKGKPAAAFQKPKHGSGRIVVIFFLNRKLRHIHLTAEAAAKTGSLIDGCRKGGLPCNLYGHRGKRKLIDLALKAARTTVSAFKTLMLYLCPFSALVILCSVSSMAFFGFLAPLVFLRLFVKYVFGTLRRSSKEIHTKPSKGAVLFLKGVGQALNCLGNGTEEFI